MVRPRVFMDFAVDGEPYGRVIFELFNDTAPKTCENFRSLCTGEKGVSANGHALYYKDSIVHRSIKNFMIQGGDFSKRNGTGGESIYGGTFPDEDLETPLDSSALLCMANKGPNTNGSQFFITLRECPHLNGKCIFLVRAFGFDNFMLGKHVVFGRVIKGFDDVVQRFAEVPVDAKDRPTKPIVIVNCGELELKKREPPPSDNRLSDSKKSKKSRKHRDRSPDDTDSKRGSKHKKRKHSEERHEESQETPERKETEEEYDARLEREEKERVELERKRTLARIKEAHQISSQAGQAGVRYKGRGRMKYVDPEHQYRS